MPYCENCGEEISEIQYTNFGGLCPECKRMEDARPNYYHGLRIEGEERHSERYTSSPLDFLNFLLRFPIIITGILLIGLGFGLYSNYIFYLNWEANFFYSNIALIPLTFIVGPILIAIGIYANIKHYSENK